VCAVEFSQIHKFSPRNLKPEKPFPAKREKEESGEEFNATQPRNFSFVKGENRDEESKTFIVSVSILRIPSLALRLRAQS